MPIKTSYSLYNRMFEVDECAATCYHEEIQTLTEARQIRQEEYPNSIIVKFTLKELNGKRSWAIQNKEIVT